MPAESLPTETQSTNADSASADSLQSLFSRADLLLRRFEQEAAVARAEAKRTELEIALAQARQGDAIGLQQWMAEHDQAVGGDEPPSTARALALPSWQDLLPAAQGRLAKRAHHQLASQLGPSSSAPGTIADRPSTVAAKSPSKSPAQPNGDAVAKVGARSKPTRSGPIEARSAPVRNPELLRALAQHKSEDQEQNQERRLFALSGMSGVMASILAHVLLVIFLAVVTLKMPSPPAGMAFEAASADTPQDDLDLTQTLEVATPDVAEPTSSQPVMMDASSELADVSTSLSSDFGSLAPAAKPGLPSAAASAVAMKSSGLSSANASFFGAAASGNCFCYVIDGSGSMRGGPWDAAKIELWKSLLSLKPKQRFYIIFFNRELSAIPMPGEREPAPRALYATRENLEHARRWMDTLRIGPGAPPIDALEMAIDKEPDAIYLLSDGVTKVDVPKFLRDENRISDLINGEQVRVPIHTIAFYSLDGEALMRKVAAENRGQFIYVPDPRGKTRR